jgi:NarL family two-component system response regulator LiaR
VTSIALVDDHRVVSRSLKAYLESFPDLTVVGIAASGEELLEHLDEWKPDVVLQDLLLPGGIHGIETTKRILARAPSTRVIALTASIDEARLMGALRAGALGYVRKDAEPETLLAAVRAVARGKTYIDPAAAAMVGHGAVDDLTPRETDVLRHLALGRSNREIAAALDIGDETVKTHVAKLLAKLGVENRAQTTVQALRR